MVLKKSLKGLFTNFEYITFFSCPTIRNIFCKRSISIKPLWLETIEKRGCPKSVRPSTVIYIIYITPTDFEHHSSQILRVRVVLSRWTFYKKGFFRWDTKKMLYIQNWCTIPLSVEGTNKVEWFWAKISIFESGVLLKINLDCFYFVVI